jgi:predicted O-linked N-acetylglucosamine transferase (SPINDLY family)
MQLDVQIFCYALSQNDGTEWRQRIQAEAEHFIDVSSLSSDLIARKIAEDKIQILVNLNGYTKVRICPFLFNLYLNYSCACSSAFV